MALGIPPPPTRADNGDFAWVAWYNQLYTLLSTTGAVLWSQVNKAGSSIADLQNKSHHLLTNILGNGEYHVSSAQATAIQAGATGTFKSGDATPKTITVTNDMHICHKKNVAIEGDIQINIPTAPNPLAVAKTAFTMFSQT